MAASKKKGSSKKKSITPAVRYLRYHLTNSGTPGTETSHYIDLARDLSAVNRRLMRQGRAYHIRKVTIVSANTPTVPTAGRASVSVVPDSWMARGAWKRGFQVWKKQMKEATDVTGIRAGKWSDFKVFLSTDSKAATPAVPLDNGGNAVALGEWNYTTLVTPDGTTSADAFDLHMVGAHIGSAGSWQSVGLIQSYGETRTTVSTGQPNTPATASDDPLVNMFDYGTITDEVIQEIEGENDDPPYQINSYAGDNTNMPKPIVAQDGTLSDGRLVMGGFTALCGLLEFEINSQVASDVYSVLIEVAPGNFRGVAAESI